MRGFEIHKAMLSRCEALMNIEGDLPDDLSAELVALAAGCEAYEDKMFPMNWAHDPEAVGAVDDGPDARTGPTSKETGP